MCCPVVTVNNPSMHLTRVNIYKYGNSMHPLGLFQVLLSHTLMLGLTNK